MYNTYVGLAYNVIILVYKTYLYKQTLEGQPAMYILHMYVRTFCGPISRSGAAIVVKTYLVQS